jgi:hypothetical protein
MPFDHASDELVSGGRESRRRRERVVRVGVGSQRLRRRGLLIIAAIVIAAAFGLADRTQRTHEFRSLLSGTADARLTAQHAEARVRSMREYTMPVITSSSSSSVRIGLDKLIDDTAVQGAAEVRATRAAIAAKSVLPWHTSLRKAQAADLAYLDAWAAYLDDVAGGGVGNALTGELSARLDAATIALRAAAPDKAAARSVDAFLGTGAPS